MHQKLLSDTAPNNSSGGRSEFFPYRTQLHVYNERRLSYEEIAQAGRVTIRSKNPDAVDPVQNFLRFEITEPRTREALGVEIDVAFSF